MHRADVRTGLVVFKRLKVHPFLAWLWRVLQSAEATDKYMCESPKATSLGCTVTDCEVANVSVGTHLLDIVPEPASSCGISLAQGFRSVPPAEPAPEALRSLSLILLFLVLEPRSALESFTHLLVSTASSGAEQPLGRTQRFVWGFRTVWGGTRAGGKLHLRRCCCRC